MQIASRLHHINEYYFSSKLREIALLNAKGKNIINLGIGSPDLPPHPSVIGELCSHSIRDEVHSYQSYKGIPQLRQAISSWYSRYYGIAPDPESEILPLIGSKEGILHICMTYLDNSDKALVPDPGYPTYASAVKLAGAEPVYYKLTRRNNWFPDFDELENMAGQGFKLMFLNYPHMPTGQLPERKLFDRLVAFAAKYEILLVHDNPYSFILNDEPMSILASPGGMDHAIELNSLSKSHNMAGWRIGMTVGRADRIAEILRFKSNMDSGMFLPLQLAAIKALELGEDWFSSLNKFYKERREAGISLLSSLGCYPGEDQAGMFLWAEIPGTYSDSYSLSDEILNKASVFITPGGIFGEEGKRFIRLSLCSPVELINEANKRINDTKSFR